MHWTPRSLVLLLALATRIAFADGDAATAALVEAQDEYVRGNYGNALTKARLVLTLGGNATTNNRAQRIIGASGCFIGDRTTVDQALVLLASASDREFISYICTSKGMPLDGKKPPAPAAATKGRDALLARAQQAYVEGNFAGAIEKARRAGDTARAWRIVGASHCSLKDRAAALEAWNRGGAADRQYIRYVCARNGVTLP